MSPSRKRPKATGTKTSDRLGGPVIRSILGSEEEARALLNDHSEVRERYHREFACLLVDEFQDTN
ncbi:MAG: UvrD-helicase domain-containing protein, partial [Acidobacteriia bacterium]|nr:UvrD-helicase domain-containing protein [Terriglobia bacterium]